MLSEYLLIGQVLRPQGIKGLVKIRPDTDDPERFGELETVYLQTREGYQPSSIGDVSVRGDGVYLRLGNAQTRDEAEKQRGLMLYVDREHARALEENETFICDLIGCRVLNTKGIELGMVRDVLQPGGNDVYVIRTPKGEMLLPALRFVVPEIHAAEGYLVIDESRLHEVAVCDWEKDGEA